MTLPRIEIAADTTDFALFGVGLKLIAVQDPGHRDREIWEACHLDTSEDATKVGAVIAAAVRDRPVLQVVTDQGTPYRATDAQQVYEEHGLEHAPAKEGAPPQKATLERSFGTIKRLLQPIVALTTHVAQAVPVLKDAGLAKIVGRYLVALTLDAYRVGRDASVGRAVARPADRDEIEALIDASITRRREAHGSALLDLERLHEEYRMDGSPRTFARAYRRHRPEDIHEADRRLRARRCLCDVKRLDRYFAAILRK